MDQPPFVDYAKMHIETTERIFGVKLDFDEASILKLDELIQKGWPDEPPKQIDNVVILFGSFLGEALRHALGGDWDEYQGQWFVKLGDMRMNVFSKVKKRLLNGEEDSISFYYQNLKQLKENNFDVDALGKKL